MPPRARIGWVDTYRVVHVLGVLCILLGHCLLQAKEREQPQQHLYDICSFTLLHVLLFTC